MPSTTQHEQAQARRRAVAEAIRDGAHLDDVAREFGLNVSTVREIAIGYSVPIRPPRRWEIRPAGNGRDWILDAPNGLPCAIFNDGAVAARVRKMLNEEGEARRV